jgi:hypothetical protein
MESIVTSDLSKFGYRELDRAGDLLKAYAEFGFDDMDNVQLVMNTNSGYVFLTSEDSSTVLMMNGDKLEKFYSCNECGNEGFANEVMTKSGRCNNCHKKGMF